MNNKESEKLAKLENHTITIDEIVSAYELYLMTLEERIKRELKEELEKGDKSD